MKFKVKVETVKHQISRAHNAIVQEMDEHFQKLLFRDIPFAEYDDMFRRFWYQKTKSLFESKQPYKQWLIFDTEEDYIRFLLEWSD